MFAVRIDFQLAPDATKVNITHSDTITDKEVSDLFSEHAYHLARSLQISASTITLHSDKRDLTPKSISQICKAIAEETQAKYTQKIAREPITQDDDEIVQDLQSSALQRCANEVALAVEKLNLAKTSTRIRVEYTSRDE